MYRTADQRVFILVREEDTMNPIRRTRKVIRPLVLALAVAGVPAAAVASAQSANATTCAVTWGSLVKQRPGTTTTQISTVRSGARPVTTGWSWTWAARPRAIRSATAPHVYMDGSGALVPLRGGAKAGDRGPRAGLQRFLRADLHAR